MEFLDNESGYVRIEKKDEEPFAYDFNAGRIHLHFYKKINSLNGTSNILCSPFGSVGYTLYHTSIPIESTAFGHTQDVDWSIKGYQPYAKYNCMIFTFPEFNYLFSLPMIGKANENGEYKSESKRIPEGKIKISGKDVDIFFVSQCIVDSDAEGDFIKQKKTIEVRFNETDDFSFIEKIYRLIDNTFAFICNRRNIGCRSAVLRGEYPSKDFDEHGKLFDTYQNVDSFISFYDKYRQSEENKNEIPKAFNLRTICNHIDKLFEFVADDLSADDPKISISSVHPSAKARYNIDLNQSLHITAAFEFYFRKYLPAITGVKDYDIEIEQLLQKYASEHSGKAKKKALSLANNVIREPSLQDKVKKAYYGYDTWSGLKYCLPETLRDKKIDRLASEINKWRNELAHEKRNYEPKMSTIDAVNLVEQMNYAIVLRKVGFADNEIRDLLKYLFDEIEDDPLVFWGVGNNCKQLLRYYDIHPEFYIDSNPDIVEYRGKKVFNPGDIRSWDELYIIITPTKSDEIKNYLVSNGLKEHKDFEYYKDYFNVPMPRTVEGSLRYLKNFVDDNPDYIHARWLNVGLFVNRENDKLQHFYELYASYYRNNGERLIFNTSDAGVINQAYMDEHYRSLLLNDPVFSNKDDTDEITDNENSKLLRIEERYVPEESDYTEWHNRNKARLAYIKKAFDIVQPSCIIEWGWLMADQDIVKIVADEMNIPVAHMEFGQIPGTYQICDNIEFESAYYSHPEKLLSYMMDPDQLKAFHDIVKYVRANAMDTIKTEFDEGEIEELRKLDKKKRTVFFIGTSDFQFSNINKSSDLWKKTYGRCCNSSEDMAIFVSEVCRNNDWNFIYKPHPEKYNENRINPNKLASGSIYIEKMLIDNLIKKSDVVISMGSAADFKVMINEIPLISIAPSLYEKFKCTYKVGRKQDIQEIIKTALDKGFTTKMKNHFEAFIVRYLYNNLWDKMDKRNMRYGKKIEEDYFN